MNNLKVLLKEGQAKIGEFHLNYDKFMLTHYKIKLAMISIITIVLLISTNANWLSIINFIIAMLVFYVSIMIVFYIMIYLIYKTVFVTAKDLYGEADCEPFYMLIYKITFESVIHVSLIKTEK